MNKMGKVGTGGERWGRIGNDGGRRNNISLEREMMEKGGRAGAE